MVITYVVAVIYNAKVSVSNLGLLWQNCNLFRIVVAPGTLVVVSTVSSRFDTHARVRGTGVVQVLLHCSDL